MKSVNELFTELDYWKEYTPNNSMSSIAKVNHIQRVKREIASRIDIEEYRDFIMSKEGD